MKTDAKTNAERLHDFIKTRVAESKLPDKVLVVEELPMTASGKIKKTALQDQLTEELKTELR